MQLDFWESDRHVGAATVTPRDAATAQQLPQSVYLGTSSWSFPGWRGIVYDRKVSQTRLAREGLAAYARHPLLRCVGIDRSYYAPVPAADYERYARSVPSSFRFLVKAPESCTARRFPRHPRAGSRAGEPNPLFLHAAHAVDAFVGPVLEGLGEHAGPLVFQFPAAALRRGERAEDFAEQLGEFLLALPKGPLYATEIRTRGWLTAEYASALRAAGAIHCLSVHPSMPDLSTQADAVTAGAAPALVVRWMLGHGRTYENAKARFAPFDRVVDEDLASRSAIARLCCTHATRGRPAYVTINNKAEGSAPLSAFALAARISELEGQAPSESRR